MARDFDLRTVEGLRSVIQKLASGKEPLPILPDAGTIFCPSCGAERRVDAQRLSAVWKADLKCATLSLTCRQCRAHTMAVVYPVAPDRLGVALLHDSLGGATPHTPTPVAYYLDQARRSELMGARSAAVAMYRAALEQLLHEQGFTSGMLAAKITALEAQRGQSGAPAWLNDLDGTFLTIIKDLGNSSIHPNGGDITLQAAFDEELLRALDTTFAALLDLVYERHARQRQLLAKLQAARTTPTPPTP